MTRAQMEEILRRDYGINNEKELLEAVEKEPGIDIGVFTKRPQKERSVSA